LLLEKVNSVLYRMDEGIFAQCLPHTLSDHHDTPISKLNARPAAKHEHGSAYTGGEEALRRPIRREL
jgi:hypothetical protein